MATITINGEARKVADGLNVETLLAHVGRDPSLPGVAVAVGGRVVRRSEWGTTVVSDGDRVEVITAAQGG